jgi:hypothetical protein
MVRNINLFFPGQFEDALIYGGQLVGLTHNGSLKIYDLRKVIDSFQSSLPEFELLLTLMFVRNDWLTSAQSKLWMRDKEVAKRINTAFEQFPKPYLVFDEHRQNIDEIGLRITASVLLDFLIYNNRLYVGADSGFYHWDIHWNGELSFRHELPEKRLDSRCVSTSFGYGVVNASCGNDGLFTAINEHEFIESGSRNGAAMMSVADKSIRSAWYKYNIINYSTNTSPAMILTTHENLRSLPPSSSGTRQLTDGTEVMHAMIPYEPFTTREKNVVTGVASAPIDFHAHMEQILADHQINKESIQYTYNSDKELIIYTSDGMFYALEFRKSTGQLPTLRFTKTYKGVNNRVLSIKPSKLGLIIETDNAVYLFKNGTWNHILDSEIISVRTHEENRHLQNIVIITKEDGIILSSLFDDSILDINEP